MARVKRGQASHQKHKKVYKQAKGFRGRRKNTIRVAKQAVEKSLNMRIVTEEETKEFSDLYGFKELMQVYELKD